MPSAVGIGNRYNPRDVDGLCRAAELRGATPLARVTPNQSQIMLRFLDTGIHGVHVPWVNTAQGGAWWEVAVAEVSDREHVRVARAEWEVEKKRQRVGV